MEFQIPYGICAEIQEGGFWCKGYYVDTAGKNASRIAEYIKNQLKEDELGEQLTFGEKAPFKK